MKKKTVLFSVFLVLMMVGLAVSSRAVNAEKQSVRRDIVIVYDNSGSMYSPEMGNPAWCQALYAVEVFASMMNEGDNLWVYPMADVTAGGETYYQGQPIKISSPEDAEIIRDINTPVAGGTPIESIDWAYEGLKQMNGDEKWLIVLSDGTTFHQGGVSMGEYTVAALTDKLGNYNKYVNVMYLGIGEGAALPDLKDNGKFARRVEKAPQSREVLDKLTSMCNQMFGRDELSGSHIQGDKVHFDVSMKRLIIFLQGEDISDVTLTGPDGRKIPSDGKIYTPSYNTNNEAITNGSGSAPIKGLIDTSLQGVIVNYTDDLQPGTYTLDYKGNATSKGIYYEPDVDLTVFLEGPDGKTIPLDKFADPSDPVDVTPGSYEIHFGLIDAKTGKMTEDELLGDTHYEVKYKIDDKDSSFVSDKKKDVLPLEFKPGAKVEIDYIRADYLSGYRIVKTGEEVGWPKDGIYVGPEAAGNLEIRTEGGPDGPYLLSQLETGEPFKAYLYYDGEKLEPEEVGKANISVETKTEGLKFEAVQEDDHYLVKPHYGDPAHPEKITDTEGTADIKVTYTAELHEEAEASASISFKIENDVTGLSVSTTASKKRFTLSELDGYEIPLSLLMGGEQLTSEELDNLKIDVVIKDEKGNIIPFTVEKLPDARAAKVTLSREGVKKGNYTASFQAETKDEIGQPTKASASYDFKVRLLPVWVVPAIIAAAIALLAALIWFILSRKVLPSRARLINVTYMINGLEVAAPPGCRLNNGGKSRGSLTISYPRVGAFPAATGNIVLTLEAVDTRYKVLRKKLFHKGNLSARCTSISAFPTVNNVNANGNVFNWDITDHHLILPPGADHFPPFTVGNNALIIINGNANDGMGGIQTLNMSATLLFS